MKAPPAITIDFETEAIDSRPIYPPEPVGVAIKYPGHAAHYYAWGHASDNNCSRETGIAELRRAWEFGLPLLFHNAKFDVAVACEKLGLGQPDWEHVHDTMFLAFLADPHAPALGLKPLAEDMLGLPPEERDAVVEWILSHKNELPKIKGKAPTKRTAGAWISYVPGGVVEPYAIGDVERTAALFAYLWPMIQRNHMAEAYDRERRLLPILMENELLGMRVDLDRLGEDVETYREALDFSEEWMRRELKASGLNFDEDRAVSSVLLDKGIVPEKNWQQTKTGLLCMKKDILLPEHFTRPDIASALGYRNRLKTCLKMFMEPWLCQAIVNDGRITTNWNQVRNPSGGTRTGRPSTNHPNFLNISKTFADRGDGYVHPAFLNVAPLPLVRDYILPDEGDVILHRDFDGQEMRVFAHFEEGDLMAAYLKDPDTDPHKMVGDKMTELMGQEFSRGQTKILNFQAMYGGGINAAATSLHCSYEQAKEFKHFHNAALPGRMMLNSAITQIMRAQTPLRTLGGRIYYAEPPKKIDGQWRSFEYKLINYLVQGSAADLTKQAMIQWDEQRDLGERFLVQVYDEINISVPEDMAHKSMAKLKAVMEQPRMDVPMRSSGKVGYSWGQLETWDD